MRYKLIIDLTDVASKDVNKVKVAVQHAQNKLDIYEREELGDEIILSGLTEAQATELAASIFDESGYDPTIAED